MRHRALALCAGLLLALLPGPALAAVTLDQHNNNVPLLISTTSSQAAQTFTVGKTGTLTRVDLYLQTDTARLVKVVIDTLNPSGFPVGSSLDHRELTITNTGGAWVSFSLTGSRHVNAGEKYAIVFNIVAGYVVYGSTNTYSGGQALVNAGGWETLAGNGSDIADFAFRTYVNVPPVAPRPTATPTPTPTPAPTPTPTATPTATPVPVASPTATESGATEAPSASTPSSGSGSGSGGSSDMTIPVVVAVIVVLVLLAGGLWFVLARRRAKG